MKPATQWAELELGSSDAEGSSCDSAGEREPWHHISGMKRVLIFGGTLAFALVFVVGVAGTATAKVMKPHDGKLTNVPASTTLSDSVGGRAPAVRGALAMDVSSPYAPQPATPNAVLQASTNDVSSPGAMGQQVQTSGAQAAGWTPLTENKRRRPTGNLKPAEHMQDGNVCDDSEELYASLCYTKCSVLTGLPLARRSTAFSCCPTDDCQGNIFKMKTASLLPCHGYDVSSSDGGIACPHIRGECLEDEEQFLGECFEKCAVLTHGKYTQRIAAASCCHPDATGGCFNFGNDYTNANLNVGGGAGDGDASTPQASHFPLEYLTEKE